MNARVAIVDVRCREAEVAGQAVVVAGAQGVPVQQRDGRFRTGSQDGRRFEKKRGPRAHFEIDAPSLERIFCCRRIGGQVVAGAESPAAAGQDQDPNRRVAARCFDRALDPGVLVQIQGVELVRAIEDQVTDRSVVLDDESRCVAHGQICSDLSP